MAAIFVDSKTFADASARQAPDVIVARYAALRGRRDFDLKAFVAEHFQAPSAPGTDVYEASPQMEDHIRALWRPLTRPPDSQDPWSTLIPLPNAYVVPGGRFREVYYWDSYFTMLGLIESGRLDLVKHMLDNFAYLDEHRRTHPERQSHLLPEPQSAAVLRGDGGAVCAPRPDISAGARVSRARSRRSTRSGWTAPTGSTPGTAAPPRRQAAATARAQSLLGRHPGAEPGVVPRGLQRWPGLPDADREAFYRNMRATAESGWDFSSRWMRDPTDLRTLETTDLIPVDLNSLLYQAERMIAALRRARGMGDDAVAGTDSSAPPRTGSARCSPRPTIPQAGSSSMCAGRPASG